MTQAPQITRISTAPLLKLLTVAALAAATALLGSKLRTSDTAWIEPPAHIEQELDPKLIEIASLGHLPSWVDAVLIRSFADPAYDPVLPGTHPPLYYELKLATALDPYFYELYYYGASILSIIRRDGAGAAELLERAHNQIQSGAFQEQGWQLELFRGYNALFELQDGATAAQAFETAARLPHSPPYIKTLAQSLTTPEGRYVAARRSFETLLKRKNDPETQRILEERNQALETSERLYKINQAFLEWLGKRKPDAQLFDRFRGSGYAELRWDEAQGRVETIAPRQELKGFY